MDLFSNRIMNNKMKLKIKTFNDMKNSNYENKQFPNLKPSSSKNNLKKKSYSFGNKKIENSKIHIKIGYKKENNELKLKVEILENEIKKLKNENNELKKKLEDEFIPRNKKKIILINHSRIKFNSFNDYSSINTTTTKIESKLNSEQNRKTEKNIPNYKTIDQNINENKFKLIQSRQTYSLNKYQSYSNINEIMKFESKDFNNKMEIIRKRALNLFEHYNNLLQDYHH